jgi:hypothetical protein
MLAKAALIAVVALALLIAPSIGFAQAPQSQSAGSRVGTIIDDAIEVALPNTTQLIDAVFARTERADKAAVKAASDAQAALARQAANSKLQRLSDVAAELSVVGQYLEQTVRASEKVSLLLAQLDGPIGTTASGGLTSDWEELDKLLQKLTNIKISQINNVDSGLRLRLLEVRRIYDANRSDIRGAIYGNEIPASRSKLRAISSLLNGVVAIAGIEIANLQDGFESVVKSTGMTPQEDSPAARAAAFSKSANDNVAAARRTLTRSVATR